MTRILFLVTSIFISFYCNSATMVFDNGFESGNLNGFKCSGNCPKISQTIVANGKYSGDFVLTRNMNNSYRTEVTLTNGKGYFNFGQEYWMGMTYRYEDWNKDRDSESGLFQVHARLQDWTVDPDTGKAACTVGSQVSTGPFMLMTENDMMQFITFGGKTLWETAIPKQQWINIVVHFKISTTDNGFIEAWVNGDKIGRVDGQNHLKKDSCGNDFLDPYIKLGIYKWNWKDGRPATDSTRRELVIDNIKIAKGEDGYQAVSNGVVIAPEKDVTPPVISNVITLPNNICSSIKWETNEPANGFINYGTESFDKSISHDSLTTSHALELIDLLPNTTYQFRIKSADKDGNVQESPISTFTTSAACSVS